MPAPPTAARLIVWIGAFLLAGCCGAGARAADGVGAEVGEGPHVTLLRISAVKDWDQRWFPDDAWILTGFWDTSLARWNAHNPAGGNHRVTDLGLTPTFRLEPRVVETVAPYVELAVGVHYISDHRIYAGRDMSTHFQFGDLVGTGLSFGSDRRWELGYRLQHLSNAGIQNPNPGINFHELRLTRRF